MEENVALDSSKQKQFIKSIKGIKKILKVKDQDPTKKGNVKNVLSGKIKKPSRKKRGLVYLSHIPHGFYEHQMTEYFKQFGCVTNARVIRSKRTGMSKGHAFVEFRDPNVAEIVAETMNNYLMGKRLIKAAIVPPEKQRKFAKRKHWNAQNNPGNDSRQKYKKAHNSVKNEKEELQLAKKLLSNLNKTKKRLRELDIDYDFFTPVDIPEPLLNVMELKKEEDVKMADVIKKEDKSKNKVKKEENGQNDNKKNKAKIVNDIKENVEPDSSNRKKSKKSKNLQQSPDNKTNLDKTTKDNVKSTNVDSKKNVATQRKVNKQDKKSETKSNKSETQKDKEKKLKEAGVKLPENFISIQKESDNDESESSVNFDSDEYDKVMGQDDSDVGSDDESDEDLSEEITSEEDASDENEASPPKKVATPPKAKVQTQRKVQQGKKQNANKPPPQLVKTMTQKDAKPSKKPKFEKKDKKTMNKVIKKKK